MIVLKIVDENKNVLYKKEYSSEGLKKASSFASNISGALPAVLPMLGLGGEDIGEDDLLILPVAQLMLEHGAKGACTFQIKRTVWEKEIKPIIEGEHGDTNTA
jgi:hypothetical protein